MRSVLGQMNTTAPPNKRRAPTASSLFYSIGITLRIKVSGICGVPMSPPIVLGLVELPYDSGGYATYSVRYRKVIR